MVTGGLTTWLLIRTLLPPLRLLLLLRCPLLLLLSWCC
jgi:hypothetical protein